MKILKFLGKLSCGLLLAMAVNGVSAGEVPMPEIPKAKSNFSAEQSCVEPTDFMRQRHGLFLKHYRHDTMRRGMRTLQHSLVACINCHVTADESGNYPTVHQSSKHFCRSCHTYAAVNIDCFQCHTSKPQESFSVDIGPVQSD
ncbi:hypothetical protein QUF74_06630 [Candidatus Halobeggiatoa sp. HSG11]|nr:hypothetical protein [Candidatus Halobeggiatoa sp. HSG11]